MKKNLKNWECVSGPTWIVVNFAKEYKAKILKPLSSSKDLKDVLAKYGIAGGQINSIPKFCY